MGGYAYLVDKGPTAVIGTLPWLHAYLVEKNGAAKFAAPLNSAGSKQSTRSQVSPRC